MSTPLDAAQVRDLIAEGRERECPDDECNCGGYTTMRLCDALESALGAVERLEATIAGVLAILDAHDRQPVNTPDAIPVSFSAVIRHALTGVQHHG